MKYFSMFSGIGGFELGIQRALDNRRLAGTPTLAEQGVQSDTDTSDGQRRRSDSSCVGYSEIDKYAIKVYERQFNGHTNYGDATTINVAELPDFDLLVGGFPCQAFSIAGKRRGFDDTRGTLFFDIARILAEKRPRHLVLENVKGLLSHDSGKTFQTILGVLSDLGYRVEWQVLNSKDFGVPQNRERVFIVGHLRGECSGEVFPITENGGLSSQAKQISSTLQAGYGSRRDDQYVVPVLTPDRAEKRQNGRRMKENGEPAFTVTAQDRHGLFDGARIRRLTPLECERLQGFPDNWTALGVGEEPISDTQRYKMCGNAVTVNVVEAVIEKLFEHEPPTNTKKED